MENPHGAAPSADPQASHLHFQMWDQHLGALNTLWDLAAAEAESTQRRSELYHRLWDQHLLRLNQSWQISAEIELPVPTSWVKKLLWPFKKRLIHFLQASLQPWVEQQNAIHAQMVQTCNGLAEALDQMSKTADAQKAFNARIVQTLNAMIDLTSSELQHFYQGNECHLV